MATSGQLPAISASTDIEVYFERLRSYFTVHGTSVAKQLPTLIRVMGDEAYTTLRNLCLPGKVNDKSLSEIEEILENYYSPPKSETVYRLAFQKRAQELSESVIQYITALKKMAVNCNFEDLEVRLKDQLIFGIKNEQLQKKLLEDRTLTFVEAVKIATAFESALQDAAEVNQHQSAEVPDINWLSRKPNMNTPAKGRFSFS